jgi:hypothetical protein
MMMTSRQQSQQDLIKYYNQKPTPATNFLSQFTSWAKIWMSSSSSSTNKKIPRKRKTSNITNNRSQEEKNREMDIRSRINYYGEQQPQPQMSQREISSLYRATCQKLRTSSSKPAKGRRLGDILHIRNLWDELEQHVYKDLCQAPHYLPPSKKVPFNPDKPGSIYLPRISKRHIIAFTLQIKPKRRSFASSTIVYISTPSSAEQRSIIKVLTAVTPKAQIQEDEDDDDDVPLGALLNIPSAPTYPLPTAARR